MVVISSSDKAETLGRSSSTGSANSGAHPHNSKQKGCAARVNPAISDEVCQHSPSVSESVQKPSRAALPLQGYTESPDELKGLDPTSARDRHARAAKQWAGMASPSSLIPDQPTSAPSTKTLVTSTQCNPVRSGKASGEAQTSPKHVVITGSSSMPWAQHSVSFGTNHLEHAKLPLSVS